MRSIGRNQNKYDAPTTTDHTPDATTAITIAAANPLRMGAIITLAPGTQDAAVHIRYYAASEDNEKHGADTLIRRLQGNDNLFVHRHVMSSDNIYLGEISAITESGSVDITIMEF